MKKIICVVSFALFVLVGNAQDLKGTWVLNSEDTSDKIEILKKSKSMISTGIVESIKLEKELPIKLLFEDSYFYCTFSDNSTLEGGYRVDNGVLHFGLADRVVDYEIRVQEKGVSFLLPGSRSEETIEFIKVD